MVDLSELEQILGSNGLIQDQAACAAAGVDWRGLYSGPVLAIARPASAEEASAVIKWAACQSPPVALVPQGGNSSLAGGSVPISDAPPSLILSSARLNQIREIDLDGRALIAGSGVILEDAKEAVAPLEFPVDLAARGSAQIGGLLASHAGGLNVVRYGSLRSHVLGLEAVLPNGEIWHGLKTVTKDNSGYDLKSLLVGSEGTLGFITAAAIRLSPPIAERSTFLMGLSSPSETLDVLQRIQTQFHGQVLAAELMPREAVLRGIRAGEVKTNPFGDALEPWLMLIEIAHRPNLAEAEISLAQDLLSDHSASIQAQSAAQAAELWNVREGMQRAQGQFGASIKHDVSVPLSKVPDLLSEGMALASKIVPGCAPLPFGHLGDGSFHFNISAPEGMAEADFRHHTSALNETLHDLVESLGGSMSAEHGLGQYRRDEAHRLRDPAASSAMSKIKGALDPLNIFNPGKVLKQP